MRFPISYNGPSKVILGALGAGPGKSWAEVDAGTIRARVGWAGHVEIPRSTVRSVERADRVPRLLGYGVHGFGTGTWALNGSNDGAVKLTLSEPASGKVAFFPMHPTVLYLSLDDPDGFIAAVQPTA